MPYGIPNETKEQTKWMESCVESVMKSNKEYTQGRAIAICKAQLKRNDWKVPSGESELSMREELWELETKIRDAINGPVMEHPTGPWVADVFDDYVIIEKGPKLYKINWSMSGGDVLVDWDSAVEVERKTVYEPISNSSKTKHRRITWGYTTI